MAEVYRGGSGGPGGPSGRHGPPLSKGEKWGYGAGAVVLSGLLSLGIYSMIIQKGCGSKSTPQVPSVSNCYVYGSSKYETLEGNRIKIHGLDEKGAPCDIVGAKATLCNMFNELCATRPTSTTVAKSRGARPSPAKKAPSATPAKPSSEFEAPPQIQAGITSFPEIPFAPLDRLEPPPQPPVSFHYPTGQVRPSNSKPERIFLSFEELERRGYVPSADRCPQ